MVKRRYGTLVRVKDWEGILVVDKGLSAIVHGYLIDLKRDHDRREATVCVAPIDDRLPMTQVELADVTEAAVLLAARAKRFLGGGWTVVGWKPPTPPLEPRIAGVYLPG